MIIRDTLTADRTYYVRTNGNDNNNGLTNDAAGAFLTIQKAVDVVCNTLDNMGYNVTIQVADGAYNAAVRLKSYIGTGSLTLKGNTATPANVTITVTGDAIVSIATGQLWNVNGFKVSTTGSGHCIVALSASINILNIDFGACANAHISTTDGVVTANTNYTISGSAVYHINASSQGLTQISNRTITLTGTPNFSICFASATNGSIMASSTVFSGAATGPRYIANILGLIFTNGAGVNFLPGNSAGSTSAGGVYA